MAVDEEPASSLYDTRGSSGEAAFARSRPGWARGSSGGRSNPMVPDPPRHTEAPPMAPSLVTPWSVAVPPEGAMMTPSPSRGTIKGQQCTFSASDRRGTLALPEVPTEEDSLQQAAAIRR